MKNFDFLKNCPLFINISEKDYEKMADCLVYRHSIYEKYQYVFENGNETGLIGIVLSGEVQLITDDYWGNRTILSRVTVGDIFGEALAFSDMAFLPVSVVATEKSEIILIRANKILSPCPNICPFHTKLIENTVHILANKNADMLQKMKHITMRTTKEKLLSYLSLEAQNCHSNSFSIPFSREELANYLSVDRSAMSNELCKMRDSGILEFNKNKFILKKDFG